MSEADTVFQNRKHTVKVLVAPEKKNISSLSGASLGALKNYPPSDLALKLECLILITAS